MPVAVRRVTKSLLGGVLSTGRWVCHCVYAVCIIKLSYNALQLQVKIRRFPSDCCSRHVPRKVVKRVVLPANFGRQAHHVSELRSVFACGAKIWGACTMALGCTGSARKWSRCARGGRRHTALQLFTWLDAREDPSD